MIFYNINYNFRLKNMFYLFWKMLWCIVQSSINLFKRSRIGSLIEIYNWYYILSFPIEWYDHYAIEILFSSLIISYFLGHNYEQFDSYIRRDGTFCVCNICHKYKNKSITNVRYHIEAKHFPGVFQHICLICSKTVNSKMSLINHNRFCKVTPTIK